MTEVSTVFHAAQGEFFPIARTRDALADYAARRWPKGSRRKAVAEEWGLSADEARAVCQGSASQATLDRVWRHKRGGWSLVLAVFSRLLGEGIDQHLARERERHVERVERLDALAESIRPHRNSGRDDVPGIAPGARIERADRRGGMGQAAP